MSINPIQLTQLTQSNPPTHKWKPTQQQISIIHFTLHRSFTRLLTLVLSLLIFSQRPLAQDLRFLPFPAVENGQTLDFAFLGGLNAPQFNEVDLNNDGILDLLIFDRSGDILLPMINGGTNGTVDYQYAPEYARHFPELRYWVLLRDFDGDGVMDIFAESLVSFTLGIQVYKGKYVNNELQFEQFRTSEGTHSELLYYPRVSGGFTEIYVSAADYPAIDDLDGDGDLDVLTFRGSGGVVEWYKNVSVERGFGRDSLQFVLQDDCYGGIFESEIDDCPELSTASGECAQLWEPGPAESRSFHPGSTLLTLDMDNDQDKELILGDLGFDNLVLLTNCNSATQAWFCEVDCEFPSNTTPYFSPEFPATFWLDVNNDGKKDLLVSPNTPNRSENRKNVWFYENTGSNELPVFALRSKDFLVGEMLDLGSGSAPAIVDVNADGLLDIVIGNETFFLPNAERDPKLFYYRNIGTTTNPRFLLENADWLRFSEITDVNDFGLTPAFGDIDADGDLDLLVGENGGSLYFSENRGGAGNPMQFISIEKEWLGIDVGQASTPHLVDLNRDGKMDFLVGERIQQLPGYQQVGNINYFENQGTSSTPQFNSTPTTNYLGEVDTKNSNTVYAGLSAPYVIEVDGKYRLLSGTGDGRLMVYDNIDGNLTGTFSLTYFSYADFVFGAETRPAFADLNNDGQLDLIMGNDRGGLMAFSTDLNDFSVSAKTLLEEEVIQIYPNPAKEYITVMGMPAGEVSVRVYDVMGRVVKTGFLEENKFSVQDLTSGLYFLELHQEQGSSIQRMVINR